MRYKILFLLWGLPSITLWAQDGFVTGYPALAYWKLGHKKQTVVILHGGPAVPHQYLRPELDQLARVAQIIYYDQRGCGQSQQADNYHWQAHVADLHRVINSQVPGKQVYLLGSSWGSTLAMLYAYQHPEKLKGLILSGTVAWEGKGLQGLALEKHIQSRYTPQPLQILQIKLTEHRAMADKQGKIKVLPIEKQYEYYAGPQSALTRLSWASAPVLDSLRKVLLPVLLMKGEDPDCSIDNSHQYKEIFPHVELVAIPVACHDPWFSNPKLFVKACQTFIRRHK